MSDLEYSTAARNILNRFHRVEAMVYVEGDDDVRFWEIVLEKTYAGSYRIEAKHGKPELIKFVPQIISGELENTVLAFDSDYPYVQAVEDHSNIISTYGYSIENSLINACSIKSVIVSHGRFSASQVSEQACEQWLNSLVDCAENLVVMDVLSQKNELGIAVLGDSSERFMRGKTSIDLDPELVERHLDSLQVDVGDETAEIKSQIALDGRTIGDYLRGHFLISALNRYVVRYIKSSGKSIRLPKENLLATLFLCFESQFTPDHAEYDYYRDQVDRIQF